MGGGKDSYRGNSVDKGLEAGLGRWGPGPGGRAPCSLRTASCLGFLAVCPAPPCPQVAALLALEVEAVGPVAGSWGGRPGLWAGRAGEQKGDTRCEPEGLGSLRQVRPQLPGPGQGRAKVS